MLSSEYVAFIKGGALRGNGNGAMGIRAPALSCAPPAAAHALLTRSGCSTLCMSRPISHLALPKRRSMLSLLLGAQMQGVVHCLACKMIPHTHICADTCAHTHMHTFTHTHKHNSTRIRIRTHTHTHTHTHTITQSRTQGTSLYLLYGLLLHALAACPPLSPRRS